MNFIHDDGNGVLANDEGEEVVEYQMEIDDEQYPLTSITNLKSYLDLKPPEKPLKVRKTKEKIPEKALEENNNRTYRKYKKEDMDKFHFLVLEQNRSIRSAAKELNMPSGTAQTWHKKGLESIEKDEEPGMRKPGSGRPVGRPLKLSTDQKEYLVELVDQRPGIVLDQMMDELTSRFIDLDVSRSALHKFVTNNCNISLKRAHFQPEERNNEAKIEARFEWVTSFLKTDIDYMTKCISIDESGFNINLKRSMAWVKKGDTPQVVVLKTKAKSHTIIGAISSSGIINVQMKIPKVTAPSKKRKGPGGATKKPDAGKGGTVTGHYFNFIASTINIMNQFEEFKGNYLVIDNCPIHKNAEIRSLRIWLRSPSALLP